MADAVVKFDAWIEEGFLLHWRQFKAILMHFVPFSFPAWYIDFLVVLGIYARAVAQAIRESAIVVFMVSLSIQACLLFVELASPFSPPTAFYWTIGVGGVLISAFWACSNGFWRFILSLVLTSSLGVIAIFAFSDAWSRL